ncbi:MAG: thiamine-phosphate kinase [Proteobacteria bacterium]|nr:thiamine-phosphate kinase [Pseudomonadota bacterium]
MKKHDPQNGLGEFDLINQVFAPLAADSPGAFSLTDDAATINVPEGRELVVTKDAMVSGVHFLETDPPEDVARKLLRVNLSDLAAMGATPSGYLLAAFWPQDMELDWIQAFANGLSKDQQEFSIGLLGGDTVKTPGPLCLSLTAMGDVQKGQALRRNGAVEGDLIAVSGIIGDGALGLKASQDALKGLTASQNQALAARYRLPQPRLRLGQALQSIATSCIDISDGLIADIGHICVQSGVQAVLQSEKIPLSEAAAAALEQDRSLLQVILTGGDDYELAFTFPSERETAVLGLANSSGCGISVIGKIQAGVGVTVIEADGSHVNIDQSGWQHF